MADRNEHTLNPQILENFRALYLANAPRLMSYASKYVDGYTAEDIVQEVFLKVWQKQTFLLTTEGLKTYLFRSVQNACLDYLKHQVVADNYMDAVTRKLKIEELYFNDDPTFMEAEDERIHSIYHEIGKLPEKCREVFTLAYLNEKKSAEIAAMLNISTRTVEAQLYKALKMIRSALVVVCTLFICK